MTALHYYSNINWNIFTPIWGPFLWNDDNNLWYVICGQDHVTQFGQ